MNTLAFPSREVSGSQLSHKLDVLWRRWCSKDARSGKERARRCLIARIKSIDPINIDGAGEQLLIEIYQQLPHGRLLEVTKEALRVLHSLQQAHEIA